MSELKQKAKQVQQAGSDGDRVLAHISPHEAEVLKMMGGSGTINPDTGLPEFKKFWKNITAKNVVAAAPIVIAIVAPELIPAIGVELGAAAGSAEAAAIGGAAVSGASTALQGGSPEDILKSAAAGGAGSYVGSTVGSEVAGATESPTAGKVLGGAAGGATRAAASGGNVERAAVSGAVGGGLNSAINELFPAGPVEGSTGITPGAKGETGLTPVTSSLPPSEMIGYAPIDYGSMFSSGSTGAPGMGDSLGTGLTIPSTPSEPPTFFERLGKQALEAGEKSLLNKLTTQITDELVPRKGTSKGSSALSSTGLFTPGPGVLTSSTGVAPVERTGPPILGGEEDEEATGTWGRKTLRK